MLPVAPSYYFSWPTKENPDALYKFGSVWIEQGQKKTIIERQTYSLLDCLGDIGGLLDGLRLIVEVIIGSFTAFMMKAKLLIAVFHIVPSTTGLKEQLSTELARPARLSGLALILSFFGLNKRRDKHSRMMD